MNKFERIVYDFLKKEPKIKLFVRNIYQSIFDLIPNKMNYFINPPICKEGYFFGFHDISPFSNNDDFILSNKLEIPLRMPKINDPLTVGFWNKNLQKYNVIGQSFAWNYHKGCRLQWLDSEKKILIYNTSKNNKAISICYDITTREETEIGYPIDSTSNDGNWATSFSYERLNKLMPGYGYDIDDDGYLQNHLPEETGLFLINIKSNQQKLILSLKRLVETSIDISMKDAKHFVTHTLFSPDGEYIAFLHRWIHNDVQKRYSRLITCKKDGTDIHIAPTDGMVSHFVWNKSNGLIVYCRINNRDGHYLFGDNKLDSPKAIALNKLTSDGHQHFINDSKKFVTDTYPDRRRYAKLFIVDLETQEAKRILEVKSFRKFRSSHWSKHWACDLHPRVNNAGDVVCFDSVHTGKRAMCFMKIK